MKQFLIAIFLLTFILISSVINAANVSVSGFGSIVGGKTVHEKNLPFGDESIYLVDTTLYGLPDAAYDDMISFRPDSNFGLQIDSDLGDGLSVTAQLTARGGNNFELEAEWFYASYQLKPKFTALIGRQRLPLYMYSNYLNLGYAYHWLRPPVEVYGEGVSVFDGLSGLYKGFAGDWDYEVMVFMGKEHNETTSVGDLVLEVKSGMNATFSRDWFKLRLSVNDAGVWVHGAPIMDRDNPQDLTFSSLGFSIDRQSYFIVSELTILDLDKYVQSSTSPNPTFDFRKSWMASIGLRFGELTPHITYSERAVEFSGHGFSLFDGLVQASEVINLGLRWDFHNQAAFKADYTSSKDKSDDALLAINGKTKEVDVFAFGIDFVF